MLFRSGMQQFQILDQDVVPSGLRFEEDYREEVHTGSKDASEGMEEELESSGESLERPISQSTKKNMSYADRVRILNVRRNLNQLDNIAKEKEMAIQKTREELDACHSRIEMLTTQQRDVERAIEIEKESGNTAAVYRLQAMHRRLCGELGNEKDLESKIAATVNENALEMWKIEIEQGNFSELRKQIKWEEEELDRHHQEQAEERLQKQEHRNRLLRRRWKATERKIKEAKEEYDQKFPKALEDAQKHHEKAVKFLKKSLERVREKKASEDREYEAYTQGRMDTVLSLKQNINSHREHLRILQALDKVNELGTQAQEKKVMEAIQAQGHNVAREVFLHKRQVEFEQKKKEFMEQQKARKIEIVARILKEEAQQEKVKKQSQPGVPCKKKLSDAERWRLKTWQYIKETCDDSGSALTQKSLYPISPRASLGERSSILEASEETVPESKGREKDEDQNKTLAEPEFTGIWNQECNISKVTDDRIDLKPLDAAELEKEIFPPDVEKLHSGLIRKHRVCGREFKGCPFYSKPSLIHFKDFDIGKTYKKKMVLINAFYGINFCKLVGVSEHLKDFFTVHLDPPGPMSAGMSCEVVVTFKPLINEDLEGEVTFLSQIGPFSTPLKCSTKKCVLALDKALIDFGTHVVGETISRTVTLTNRGALGTRFQVGKSTGADAAHAVTVSPSAEGMVNLFERTDSEKGSNYSLADSVTDKETVSICHSDEVIQQAASPEKRPELMPTNSNSDQFQQINSDVSIAGEKSVSSLDVMPLVHQSREETPEITLGKIIEGDIGPFSSIKLQIIFTPAVPGDVKADFQITFDNPDCKLLHFSVVAVSVAVPVWVRNPDVDLKICMYDMLYQDCIVIQSRATSALRLKFDVCKELANHMELLPKTGYIQAQSSFSVQLKFLPRHSLPEDAAKYFDEKTRVLQVPMTIIVSDQSRPVEFTVHAVVTTSDLEINPTEVDFGYCSIYEAVQTTITLTNKSILPQEFGFVGLQEFIEVQPNDGFGILLPLETLSLDVLFKPKKAKEYSFHLTCKTEINRKFKLSCKGIGVHPPLELSHSLVQFSATALNDVSTATLFILNSHVRLSRFNHFGPRIGDGEVAPVGPTSFQFLVPEDSPITIMPCVGTVLPGKKCLLEVSFRPVLCDQLIKQEAVHLLCQAAEAKAQMERKARELELQRKKEEAMVGKKDGKRMASISFLGQLSKDKNSTKPFEPPNPEDICPNSEEYIAAHLSLVRSFNDRFDRYVIPCLVASGVIDEKKGAENLSFSPYNNLYLELHCPSVAPAVVVTSNNGRTFFNFGDVAVGHRIKENVKIQNISQEQLVLQYSLLDPFGPFLLANPIRMLEDGESRDLVLTFSPEENKSFFETLELRSEKATLTLILTGRGVITSIACSVEGDVFDMGYVLAKETATATFKIENTSTLPLKYTIVLESLSPNRDRDLQELPPFLGSQGKTDLVGTQNYSGLSVFTVSPVEGIIALGKFQEFTVTFSPDHESLHYSDCIQVLLFDKEVIRVIQLKGAARNHIMYVEGGEPLDVPIESLAVTTSVAEETAKAESDKATNSILVSLASVQSETFVIPAVRELKVGAIRTTQFASKKNVEFAWESLPLLQLKGFTVDPVKGTVERGQTKSISVSWVPPAGSDPNQPVTGSAILTVKGDVKEIYSVYFMGRIVTQELPPS
ncbi:cilia- and flagella-associated protein 74 isoform X2 [Sceloporus undulatus]|uniref:cilia- and flagella-associated protein 74 isoform X2 n=1 Tax=Sceloporus undulatus TaxID=8520 RepID=UPI001C4D4F93|nr:cilia- and flagella-associated protein 74 isoform X2 [Sceloporus undulatus]XP_042335789.1 cilia- and flagella-associated protein 74 isoform X2 [Sceloporus undulatus]